MFICVCLSICGLFNFYPQNERWESFFFIGGCEELSSVYREGVNARRRGNLLKMLLIKLCGNCRPCTFMEYMFCWGRKKLVDKMHELIHVHVTRTFKRFTTQLIHLFIDVAQCSMYIRSTKTLHHVDPYSLWDYSVESWKRWQHPLIRTGSKHCRGKKCFSNRSTTKSLSCPRHSIRPKKALSM